MSIRSKTDEELRALSNAAQNELSRRQAEAFQQANASKVGKYFKTRNSYSCPEKPSDYWWTYEYCTSMDKDGMLKTFQFDTDKYGDVRVKFNHHAYHLQYAQPCTKAEFDRAFKKMQQKIARRA
jgi:hypothetical protein